MALSYLYSIPDALPSQDDGTQASGVYSHCSMEALPRPLEQQPWLVQGCLSPLSVRTTANCAGEVGPGDRPPAVGLKS